MGLTYTAAGGKSLENMGEKVVTMCTSNGQPRTTKWQMVDVTRPLTSVRQVCKQGHYVIFGMYGGTIVDANTGEDTPFGVDGNVYTLDLWMPPESGFPGQG